MFDARLLLRKGQLLDSSPANSLAGLVLRRPSRTGNNPAYFIAIRNIASNYSCGIFEWTGSARANRTPGLTTRKYAVGGAYRTLEARVLGGRVEMYVNGAFIATWVDTTPQAAAGLALQTIDGTASFDNVKVYGATR